jgi:hypothetical protein
MLLEKLWLGATMQRAAVLLLQLTANPLLGLRAASSVDCLMCQHLQVPRILGYLTKNWIPAQQIQTSQMF